MKLGLQVVGQLTHWNQEEESILKYMLKINNILGNVFPDILSSLFVILSANFL